MLTLLEASKLNSGDVVRSAVIEMFAREVPLLGVLPFADIQGNAYKYTREETLPSVAFRGVNESFTESTGVVNPQIEPLVIAGGDLDVDRFIIKTNGDSVRSTHEQMKVKQLGATIQKKFIKGDSETDPREFDGLQKRLTGAQLVDAGATSGGDALSLAKLDEAIDACTNPTHLLCNKELARRFAQAARNTAVGGYIVWGQDEFGRRILFYNDLPIVRLMDADESDTVLPFNEANPGGGANVGTSLYVASLGEGRVKGIQNGIMDVRDLGELQTAPVFRTRVEWYMGIAIEHGRAAVRLRGVKSAAFVA